LTPASGCQDHTTSPSAFVPFVNGTISVHRIPSRVRDDREAPLEWNETAIVLKVIWVKREAEYFCKWGSTGFCPTGKSPAGAPVGSDRR
jgi:hypothetical protein